MASISQSPLDSQYKTQQHDDGPVLGTSSFEASCYTEIQKNSASRSSESSAMSNQNDDGDSHIFDQSNSKDNVKVVIRVRPFNDREK